MSAAAPDRHWGSWGGKLGDVHTSLISVIHAIRGGPVHPQSSTALCISGRRLRELAMCQSGAWVSRRATCPSRLESERDESYDGEEAKTIAELRPINRSPLLKVSRGPSSLRGAGIAFSLDNSRPRLPPEMPSSAALIRCRGTEYQITPPSPVAPFCLSAKITGERTKIQPHVASPEADARLTD